LIAALPDDVDMQGIGGDPGAENREIVSFPPSDSVIDPQTK
jgi:hypothetical protein